MMLTRALLLLLAMMTGLSAAQAAENVRPIRGAPSLSAALAQVRVVTAELAEKREICVFARFNLIDQFVSAITDTPLPSECEAPIAPRTYKADRARE
jgi:hypothetical protein